MKKKKDAVSSLSKDELQKQLKRKNSSLEHMKRELKIETALEKVRARTMAMQHSSELSETAVVLFDQFNLLGEAPERMAIEIVNEKENVFEIWATEHGGSQLNLLLKASLDEPHVMKKMYKAWKQQKKSITIDLKGKVLEEYFQFLNKAGLPVQREVFGKRRVQNVATFSKGILTIITPEPRPVETLRLLERFAAVFDGTYTRFLDLKKAEAQTREAQIEVALEKIRSRTMAMHRSDELLDTSLLFFQQVKELGETVVQASIAIVNEDAGFVELSSSIHGNHLPLTLNVPIDDPYVMAKGVAAWKAKRKSLTLVFKGQELKDYNERRNSFLKTKVNFPEDQWVVSLSFFSKGWLSFSSNKNVTDETSALLKRFAAVVEQTYTRFLDLQKAEAQAREAQIEAALERVRARSMAMRDSSELHEVADVLFQQLLSFGGNILNAGFVLCKLDADDDEYWISSDSGIRPVIYIPHTDEPLQKKLYEGWKNKAEFYSESKGGDELKAHYDYLLSVPSLKPFFEEGVESNRSFPTWQKWHAAYFSDGYLFMLTAEQYDEEKILVRFAKVFEQTYTRFLDLQKAESQAREAQVEAALEKVRSRSLAMHKTDQLQEVVSVVFEKLKGLGVGLNAAGAIIVTFTEGSKDTVHWLDSPDFSVSVRIDVPYEEHPIGKDLWKSKEGGEDFFVKTYPFEEMYSFHKHLFEHTDYKFIPDEVKNWVFTNESYTQSVAWQSNSAIILYSFNNISPSEKEIEILKRFSKVFEQSYVRFLDLQKAEAQAKEGQIQLALERARTQSMIMQHSNELDDTLRVFHEQVLLLDIKSAFSFLWLPDEERDRHIFWAAWAENNSTIFKSKAINYPLDRNEPATALCLVDWKSNVPVVSYQVLPASVNDYFAAWSELIAGVEELKPENFSDGLYYVEAFMKYGCFGVIVKNTLSEDEKKILGRFAVEFERAYTRFLDLQKAEAQTREAQIEASLERVRSSMMAMHRSDGLPDAMKVIADQLLLLGIRMDAVLFFPLQIKHGLNFWSANTEKTIPIEIVVPYKNNILINEIRRSITNQSAFSTFNFSGDEIQEWWHHIIDKSNAGSLFSEQRKQYLLSSRYFSCAVSSRKNSTLSIVNYSGIQFSEEENSILKRYANVFEQTYTRFLDLQKAEAQAREAQIEAALEKVRSLSLAMHKSEEIIEVVRAVFERLNELNIELNTAFIIIFKEGSRDTEWWLINKDKGEYSSILVEYADIALLKEMFEIKEQGKEIFSATYYREQKNELFHYLFTQTDFKYAPAERQKYIFESESVSISMGMTNKVAIQITRHHEKSFSQADNEIIKRFTKVFDQSYTRFLDLQKAEAQARESQIELSLERVRAKTMAMHNSQDVGDTVATLFEEFVKLGISTNRCGILIHSDSSITEVWTAKSNDSGRATLIIGHLDTKIHPMLQGVRKGWENKESFFSYELKGEDIKAYYRAINNAKYYPTKFDLSALPSKEFHSDFYFAEGCIFAFTAEPISAEASVIFKRFAGVFGQTYRRYLDLKKAEAQAREAQIELSLERVRAKTMAMHNSQHVADTVAAMFDELVKLGIDKTTRSGVAIIGEKDAMEIWTASSHANGEIGLDIGRVDLNIHPLMKGFHEAWKNKKTYYTYELIGADLKDYYNSLNASPEYPVQFDLQTVPSKLAHSSFFFPEGALYAFSPEPLTAEASKIFKRFSGVFGQTYRRYLDLKKAEAQARSAHIEAAMEKVRARSLAMQKPEELIEVAEVLRKEMGSLGVEELETSSIYILDDAKETAECWYAIKDVRGDDKKLVSDHMIINLHDTWVGREMLQFYAADEKHTSILMQGENRKEWINYCAAHSKVLQGYYGDEIPERTYHLVKFSNGYMGAASPGNISTESWDLLQRATAVFSFAYTRFLDLQKAEAQTREAQIELALERVRARTMAMFKSDELAETAAVLFHQLIGLGIMPNRLFIGVINDESGDMEAWATNEEGDKVSKQFVLSSHRNHSIKKMYDGWKSKKRSIIIDMHGKELENYFHYLNDEMHVPFSIGLDQKRRVQHIAYSSKGFIGMASPDEQPPSTINLLERFASVFNLTYQRFTDLQQAEAQAREAHIEAALEKVRSRTLAMHKSEELAETAAILIKQLNILGIEPISLYIGIIKDMSGDMEIWSTDENGNEIDKRYIANINKNSSIKKIYDAWIGKEKFVALDMQGDELENWLAYWQREHYLPFTHEQSLHRRVQNIAYFSKGFIAFTSTDLQPQETFQLLERFAAVFNLTYTRFLDLQKAEAQAREAQIEIGLERVRSRAMAMHKTDELLDAAELVYKELSTLGVASMSINYAFVDDEEKNASYYSVNPIDGKIPQYPFIFPHTETDVMRTILAGWEKQEPFNLIELDEDATLKHQTYIGEIVVETMIKNNIDIPFSIEAFLAISPKKAVIYTFNFSKGYLFIIGSARLTKPQEEMVLRFTKVFEMTYRRFLDLKQAEAQAREAKIEASLERVRSKAMAMHSSKDLTDTIIAFYRELESLSVTPRRCGVGLINKETHIAEISSMNTTEQGDSIAVIGNLDLKLHPILKGIYDNWLLQKDYYPVLRGSEIKEYYQILTPQIDYPDYPNDVVQYGYFFFFAEGGVYAWTEKQMTENELKIYRRFTSVLTLTYKRYKDLKQAEEQAREATIEAALERVRGKAMAMRNSDDLSSAASMVFTELRKLGINPIRSGVGIISQESRRVEFYSAMSSANGDSLSLTGGVIMSGHPEFEKQYASWLKKENYFTVLKGEKLKSYYKFLSAGLNIDSDLNDENDQEQSGHWLMFSEGFLFAWSDKTYSETEINILDRFKKIVELTFRRYIELQKSEINAREAVKQAALDRVRADIASMRTTTDLEKITPLIWNELTILGIPFIRCGVFIMDDSQELIHTFLSTPDGKAIAAFHIPYDTPGNITQVLTHWQQKENYIDHWDEKAFTDFADTLVKQGALTSSEQYLQTIPHGGFHLHFLPFLQGMLYVGNSKRLDDEEIKLIQSVADAFSTAYARYEDFNKLEAAKQTVEKTLVDLKQAQQQLVQSEKMASLGELTAGIAHEIQNPLNFVNNFSEVSNELMDEMNAELDKGDIEEAKAIANDIKQNLEKINHHGKRADGIVKGMLQHSRTSSGHKELTDINVLADEYIRLCYHGLRAKDKSFNSTIKTDFDHDIEKINIIPQDIGRVLLNLYTNAFYAVNERRKMEGSEYEPTVSVSTKKSDNQITIIVSDNGNGIPQKIVDKIFQPFFTTKPTGQGTGLGLSLAYDIVKAHGGEIKVETKVDEGNPDHFGKGEGTTFIIQLPVV